MKTSTSASLGIIVIIIIAAGVLYSINHRGQRDETATIHPNPTASPAATTSTGPFVQTAPSMSPAASASPAAADTMAAQNPTVSMTDTGITPAQITVKSGTTITFINKGQTPHWPASDPHPIHTDVSGFDAKRGLTTGDFYRFTFTKVGTFSMHDHLHSTFKATITVQ